MSALGPTPDGCVSLGHLETFLKRHHSAFQVDHFIIGKQGHPYFQFLQAVLELDTRRRAVTEKRFRLREIAIEREAILGTGYLRMLFQGNAGRARQLLALDRLEAEAYDLERSVAEQLGEADRFWAHASASYHDYAAMTDAELAEEERRAWLDRFERRMIVSLLAESPDQNVIEGLLSFPGGVGVDALQGVAGQRQAAKLVERGLETWRRLRATTSTTPPDKARRISSQELVDDILSRHRDRHGAENDAHPPRPDDGRARREGPLSSEALEADPS